MPSSNAVISSSYVLYGIQSNHSGDHALASHSNDRNIIWKEFMTKNVELWIDHQKAMVLTMTEKGEDLKEIRSEVERDLEIFADDRRQSGFTERLNIYPTFRS